MRKKIWRMSEGQFNHIAPRTYLEPEVIHETIVEGETFNGSFSVICEKDTYNKGVVYSDNPYIYIITPAFNEDNPKISYQIHAKNLRAGDLISGNFYIYCDSLVKELPFSISVKRKYPTSSLGEITCLKDFCELARRSWKEAKGIFYSEEFKDLMYEQDYNTRLLYRGFSKSVKTDANLEEFLAACGCKERVSFDFDTSTREYSFVSENLKENIDITRNTWGYINLRADSDTEFITVENNNITGDFFLGSKLSLNFYIHKDKLHQGKNYGRITIKGMGIVKTIDIVASLSDINERKNYLHISHKKDILDLYKNYEAFRLKLISANIWADNTVKIIDKILGYKFEDRNFYRLIKTQALIVMGNRKKALDSIKSLRIDIVDKRSADWAYLLYLGALLDPEEEYVERLAREIEIIQDSNSENIRIFWFLLFLKREYQKDSGEKLRAIKHWINNGYNSPVLYAECYDIFKTNIYLLETLSDFNLRIISWAVNGEGLTYNIAEKIFDLISKEKEFDIRIYRLLIKAYEKSPNDIHLKHILMYMLKGNAKGEEFAEMYKLGIEAHIKLAGLFEAYIESIPLDNIEPLSDVTLRYFAYTANIPDERRALVYANIIINKEKEPGIYDSFSHKIRDFCLGQMKQNRLEDNLLVCYQDLLDNDILDSRMADNLSKMIFAKKIICLHNLARRVIVYEDILKEPVVANINNNMAFIPIFSGEYKVFIEMADGSISCDEKIYYVENTISLSNRHEELVRSLTDKDSLFFHDIYKMETQGEIDERYEKEAIKFLFSDKIDNFYLKNHFGIFMRFFKSHLREDIILNALLHNDRYKFFDTNILTYLVNLLVIDGNDNAATELLNNYLILGFDKRQLLTCVKRCVRNPEESKGEFILELCIYLLRDGYQSEETIEYLLNHFIGRIEDMRLIFKYANTDSYALNNFCERFLVQGLYSYMLIPEDDEILVAYLERRPNPMIVEAYISYFSHRYLVDDIFPPDSVFAILIRQLHLTDSVNDCCRFAYSKYLCKKSNLSPQEKEILDLLISDQLSRNIYFQFYADMQEQFIIKYHLYDRMYISINTEPKRELVLDISYGDIKHRFDIPEHYDGIYVKDLVIFFGDNIYYNIYEKGHEDISLLSGEYSYQDIGYLNESRFYKINRMQENLFFKEFEGLYGEIVEYSNMSKAAKEIFSLL